MKDKNYRLLTRLVFLFFILAVAICLAVQKGSNTESFIDYEKRQIRLFCQDGTIKITDTEHLAEELSRQTEKGYRCWAWIDADGHLFSQNEGNVIPEILFQQCYVELRSDTIHNAYIFADETGNYNLDRYALRKDIAEMFGVLLTEIDVTITPFADEDEGSWVHGAELMHQYGLVFGNLFFPDERVTLGDLFFWISKCFPKASKEYKFSDISPEDDYYEAMCLAVQKGWLQYQDNMSSRANDFITRNEFVIIMNRILERKTSLDCIPSDVIASLLDYLEDEEILCALAEAAVDHSTETGEEEKWSDYKVLRCLKPGPCYDGNTLYWIDSNGKYVMNAVYNGLRFDESGKYTSGNPELDEYVINILDEILLPDMTTEEKLRTVYEYSMQHFTFGGGLNYEWGTEDWWPDAALTMIKRGKGDCSSFAAIFCALARPLGYRMRVSTGQTFGAGVHSWAYMFVDGEEHIFDPQSEKRYARNMYDMPPIRWKSFEYDPVYSIEPEY